MPTDLRMGIPAPTANFDGLTVTFTEMQRKAAINSPYQFDRDARELEDRLEAQPQRFAMLGINDDSNNLVVWVMSQFSGPLNTWWLNRKQQYAIPYSFNTLVEEIRKTSMLPKIRDDAIKVVLGLAQGNLSYADYTLLFNDLLRRSRQPLTHDLNSVKFSGGLANFQLYTQAKSHRSQQKDYTF
jgi:hypothetical protein